MANINFGLLDTQYPEKLANAFVRTPEQQNANMLQVMQMQQLMDQREQAQYALGKSRREETGLAAFGEGLRALGPDPDPDAVAQLFIKHPDRAMQQAGVEMLQKSQSNKKYLLLKQPGGAGASPVAAAPSAAPAAPVSPFTADMMANRAALPTFNDNKLAATVAAPPALVTPRTRESRIAQLQTEAAKLAPLALPGTLAKSERDDILEEIKGLRKTQVMVAGSVLDTPGVDRVTAPEAPSQDIRTMTALGYPNTQAGYTAFRDAQRPDRLLTPLEEAQQLRLRTASRPPGATVVMPPLEKSESQEKGKLNVKIYGVIADTADRARKILPALETSEAILNNGFQTGFTANVQTQAARVLGALGVPEADKYATDSQVFLAQGRQALLQRQLEQKGAQSEGDAQRINQTFIQLGNTPEANKFLVATAKAQSKQDIARQKFWSNWWSKSKTYEGAEEAWFDGDGGKSLFDSPDMKQFAPKTQPPDIATAAAAEIARRNGTSR